MNQVNAETNNDDTPDVGVAKSADAGIVKVKSQDCIFPPIKEVKDESSRDRDLLGKNSSVVNADADLTEVDQGP